MNGDEQSPKKVPEEEKSKRRSNRKSKSRYQRQDPQPQQQQQQQEAQPAKEAPAAAVGKQKTKPPKSAESGEATAAAVVVVDAQHVEDKTPNQDVVKAATAVESKPKTPGQGKSAARGKGKKASRRPRRPRKNAAPAKVVASAAAKPEVIEIADTDSEKTATADETEAGASAAASSSKSKDVVIPPLVKLNTMERRRKKEFHHVPKLPARLANTTTLTSVVDSDDEHGREIPVFTKEFLTYNRKQEMKLAQVTKTQRELNHNNQLMKANQTNYEKAMTEEKALLEKKKAELARAKEVLNSKYLPYKVQFQYIQLPTNPQLDVMTDPEAYIKELGKILTVNDPKMMSFLILAHSRLQGMFGAQGK